MYSIQKTVFCFQLFASLFLLESCSVFMEIQKQQFSSTEEAIKVVERVMKSQGENFTPNFLIVTEELIGYSKEKHVSKYGWGGMNTGSTVNLSNNIYFDLIKDVRLYKKKAHYEIRITTTASRQTHVIFCWDKNLTEKGASAIKYLQQNAKSNH